MNLEDANLTEKEMQGISEYVAQVQEILSNENVQNLLAGLSEFYETYGEQLQVIANMLYSVVETLEQQGYFIGLYLTEWQGVLEALGENIPKYLPLYIFTSETDLETHFENPSYVGIASIENLNGETTVFGDVFIGETKNSNLELPNGLLKSIIIKSPQAKVLASQFTKRIAVEILVDGTKVVVLKALYELYKVVKN
jgi:hypothetical protein